MAQAAFRGFVPKEGVINTDQVKGALKDAAGRVQERFGELIDSPEKETKGAQSRSKEPPGRRSVI